MPMVGAVASRSLFRSGRSRLNFTFSRSDWFNRVPISGTAQRMTGGMLGRVGRAHEKNAPAAAVNGGVFGEVRSGERLNQTSPATETAANQNGRSWPIRPGAC